MSIIFHNIDDHLKFLAHLRSDIKTLTSDEQYDIKNTIGLFIDWVPTNSDKVEELVWQTEIIEEFIKYNKKIVIFDRYRSITHKEFKYLKNHKVVFWEPAIFNRKGFHYQPCWVNVPNSVDDLSLHPFNITKEFDLGYNGSLRSRFKGVTNYYESMSSVMDLTIGMNVTDIKEDKIKELCDSGINVGDHLLNTYKTMLLIGRSEDYVSGYLDPVFVECINQGVIPVLPYEHRWYHALFGDLTIKNGLTDLKRIIELYDSAGFGMIYELLTNIGKYHPEMMDIYVIDRIINNFK